jgi:hypothetical protein
VQTEAGLPQLALPRLRLTTNHFSRSCPTGDSSRTPDLEALMRGMYVRGLSTEDVDALYGEAFG